MQIFTKYAIVKTPYVRESQKIFFQKAPRKLRKKFPEKFLISPTNFASMILGSKFKIFEFCADFAKKVSESFTEDPMSVRTTKLFYPNITAQVKPG